MLGIAAFRWLVLERIRTEQAYPLLAFPALRRLWGVGWSVAAFALLLLPLRLGLQAITLFGTDAASRSGALLASTWGVSWWLQLVAAILLAVGLWTGGAQGRRAGWALVAFGALLVAVVPPLSGHAAGEHPLLVVNDAVHVAAVGTWVGGLFLVLLVGIPAIREADVPRELGGDITALATLVASFSRIAVVAPGS